MGRLIMREKMVIPQSSAFMIFSLFALKAFISSLVMSRTSMSLKSSSGSGFLKIKEGSRLVTRDDAALPTFVTLGVVKAETSAIEASNKRRERNDIMIVGSNKGQGRSELLDKDAFSRVK